MEPGTQRRAHKSEDDMRTFLSTFSLILVAAGVTEAQVRYQVPQGRRAVVQQPQVGVASATPEWAKKLFNKDRVDFGVIATGSDSKKFLRVKNVLDKAVHIRSATTTCGCSVATPSKKLLNPGEEAVIEVTMNTRRFKRRKDSNVIVELDAPSFAKVYIPITAYIRTDVVFEPGMAQFGGVEIARGKKMQLKVAYAGRADWRIKELQVRNPHLAAKFNETSRKDGRVDYVVDIILKDTAPVGRLRDLITLVTDDKANPFVPLLVEANVEPDIAVTPGVVALGTVVAGRPMQSRVVIRGKTKFEIEKVESKTGVEGFQYVPPKGALPVHVLRFALTPDAKTPGKFEEEFSVWITGRPNPVMFKITGNIAASNPRLGSNR